jgi:uncharacterized membrane protein YhhN
VTWAGSGSIPGLSILPMLAAFAVGAAVANWAAVWAGGPRGRATERVAKPLVVVALIAVACLAPAPAPLAASVRPWLVVGLAGSLVGDILLLPPGRFVPGLVAFLVAHLAYLAAFLLAGREPAWLVVGLVAGLLVGATVGRILLGAARAAGLGVPVATYLAVITLMAVAATGTGEPAAIAGAWLFVASDALLGWGRFREPAPDRQRGGGRALRTGVMVTYHAAQGLILLALIG